MPPSASKQPVPSRSLSTESTPGVCAIISFRLGMSDGVSIVAKAWQEALDTLGWETYTVAGEGPVDRLIPGLAIGGDTHGNPAALAAEVKAALARADVVLVENILTIPMNLVASRAVAEALAGRPAVLHHHDPPWQRERFADVTELPVDDPRWRHVTINQMTQAEFEGRGFSAITIYNGFDQDQPLGDRQRTRALLGIEPGQYLFSHPVRAIARKNVPAAVGLCELFDAVYWLPNQAEEGYGDELERVLTKARCPVLRTSLADVGLSVPDLYAASDLVLFPSSWEGFGNPPIEAALHRRPVVVGDYPVARELRDMGFSWLALDDLEAIARVLQQLADSTAGNQTVRSAAADMLEHNRNVARSRLSVDRMTEEMRSVFQDLGWES